MNTGLNMYFQYCKIVLGDMPRHILLLALFCFGAAREFSGKDLLGDEIHHVRKYLDISNNEGIDGILNNNDFSQHGILSHVQVDTWPTITCQYEKQKIPGPQLLSYYVCQNLSDSLVPVATYCKEKELFNATAEECYPIPGYGTISSIIPDRKCPKDAPRLTKHPNLNLDRHYIICYDDFVLVAVCDEKSYFDDDNHECQQQKKAVTKTVLIQNDCQYPAPIVECTSAGNFSVYGNNYIEALCSNCEYSCSRIQDDTYGLKILCGKITTETTEFPATFAATTQETIKESESTFVPESHESEPSSAPSETYTEAETTTQAFSEETISTIALESTTPHKNEEIETTVATEPTTFRAEIKHSSIIPETTTSYKIEETETTTHTTQPSHEGTKSFTTKSYKSDKTEPIPTSEQTQTTPPFSVKTDHTSVTPPATSTDEETETAFKREPTTSVFTEETESSSSETITFQRSESTATTQRFPEGTESSSVTSPTSTFPKETESFSSEATTSYKSGSTATTIILEESTRFFEETEPSSVTPEATSYKSEGTATTVIPDETTRFSKETEPSSLTAEVTSHKSEEAQTTITPEPKTQTFRDETEPTTSHKSLQTETTFNTESTKQTFREETELSPETTTPYKSEETKTPEPATPGTYTPGYTQTSSEDAEASSTDFEKTTPYSRTETQTVTSNRSTQRVEEGTESSSIIAGRTTQRASQDTKPSTIISETTSYGREESAEPTTQRDIESTESSSRIADAATTSEYFPTDTTSSQRGEETEATISAEPTTERSTKSTEFPSRITDTATTNTESFTIVPHTTSSERGEEIGTTITPEPSTQQITESSSRIDTTSARREETETIVASEPTTERYPVYSSTAFVTSHEKKEKTEATTPPELTTESISEDRTPNAETTLSTTTESRVLNDKCYTSISKERKCPKEGTFRYKHSCNTYYTCTYNETCKKIMPSETETCPGCLKFNAESGKCDLPENVPECDKHHENGTVNFCTGPSGKYSIPGECNKYHECGKDKSGRLQLTTKFCKKNLVFDGVGQVCSDNAKCANDTVAQCTSFGWTYDKLDCEIFHSCVRDENEWLQHVYRCPPTYIFNGIHCEPKDSYLKGL